VLVNSTNPNRIEGQKAAAHEIVAQLGSVPDVLTLPYGGGGNTKAYARGFAEAGTLPRFHPVQVAERATTIASAIRIVEPIHRAEVEQAIADSGGSIVTVDDSEIARAQRALGHEEGVFCEPASAAGVAGLERGSAKAGERVVCVVTGHGLKDAGAVA
jgi:threonine synthase